MLWSHAPRQVLFIGLVVLDHLQELLGVGAEHIRNLLAVLEHHKRRHGADRVLLGYLGELLDIDLGEVDLVVLF